MRNGSYLASWSPETRYRTSKFSDLDELIFDRQDVAILIECDPFTPERLYITGYRMFGFDSDNIQDIAYSYLTACNHSTIQSDLSTSMYFNLQSPPSDPTSLSSRSVLLDTVSTPHSPATFRTLLYPVKTLPSPSEQVLTFAAKRKYKPVALKVRPVLADLPEKYRITRHIIGDPLTSLPTLTPTPPPFMSTGRYTEIQRDIIDKAHSSEFLWPSERELMHHFMCLQNEGFAWNDSQRGRFREDFFPPVTMPVISHKPWVLRNMPIPPGIYDEVCRIIRAKIDAGVYERSNSSYRSQWFTVVKKDGTNLRIVHSLEPHNAVTIQHSGVPPYTSSQRERATEFWICMSAMMSDYWPRLCAIIPPSKLLSALFDSSLYQWDGQTL